MKLRAVNVDGTEVNVFYTRSNRRFADAAKAAEIDVIRRYNIGGRQIPHSAVNVYVGNPQLDVMKFDPSMREVVKSFGIQFEWDHLDRALPMYVVFGDMELDSLNYDQTDFVRHLAELHAVPLVSTANNFRLRDLNFISSVIELSRRVPEIDTYVEQLCAHLTQQVYNTPIGVLAGERTVRSGFSREYFSSYQKFLEHEVGVMKDLMRADGELEHELLRTDKLSMMDKKTLSSFADITMSFDPLLDYAKPVVVAERTMTRVKELEKSYEAIIALLHPTVKGEAKRIRELLVAHSNESFQQLAGTITGLMDVYTDVLDKNEIAVSYDLGMRSNFRY